jgi:hypothetical protein
LRFSSPSSPLENPPFKSKKLGTFSLGKENRWFSLPTSPS